MNKVVVLAEKPSVAKSIAAVLKADERKGGFFIGNGYIVTWCLGHLLELAAPDAYGKQYAKWRYEDLPIIPETWLQIPAKEKSEQLKIVIDLINRSDVDCIVNACDSGREGELIFRHVFNHADSGKKIKRLWISSLEEAAIKAGFANMKDGSEYDNLYAAASCRERADWLVGLNCTRAMSVIYNATLNAGRVQSPTLAMLVKREADIDSFVKEPFYTPMIDVSAFNASGERTADKQTAEMVRAASDGKPAVVRSVEKQKKTVAPPKLFDLTMLQREANRLFGFTAQQTLDYAQSLYEKTLFSYPRSDSKFLTSDIRGSVSSLVEWIQADMERKDGADFMPNIDRLIDDGKVSDHHAIIPTSAIMTVNIPSLPSGEQCLLNLVACRLLCAAAPAHVYEAVVVTIDCEGYIFAAKGKTVISEGWKEIDFKYKDSLKNRPEPEEGEEDSAALPELSKGHTFDNVAASVKEGFTTPQKHYTEDTLLSGMENAGAEDMPDDAERKGLGTPATRAAIIEKLIKAGFVERQKKNLIATDKGKNLIAVLPEALTSPKMTAEWEHTLKQVERDELSGDAFMTSITEFTKAVIRENNAPKPEYAGLFSSKTVSESLGACPRCGAPIREAVKGFFCDTRSCGFRMWKESKFWTAKKKPLTANIVTALLKDGKAAVKGLYSEKTGKKYDAVVRLDDGGTGYVNYKLEFVQQ